MSVGGFAATVMCVGGRCYCCVCVGGSLLLLCVGGGVAATVVGISALHASVLWFVCVLLCSGVWNFLS